MTSTLDAIVPQHEIICSGFVSLQKQSCHVDDRIEYDNNTVTIRPASATDFWRKTYYKPILVKDDAPFLYCGQLQINQDYTVETHFTLTAVSQFDQAGLLIRLSHQHWIKAGIEVVDQIPRLSCVVTNVYSDWSTQPWKEGSHPATNSSVDSSSPTIVVPECRIRIHCLGMSFVVEAWINGQWEFIRIAHMSIDAQTNPDPLVDSIEPTRSPEPSDGELWVGIFGASPQAQLGCAAQFTFFEITKGSKFDHKA